MSEIGILNVGAGDTKITFDKNNPAECIRAGRIVQDMLRRGYALLVEVPDGKGGKAFTRVHEFKVDTFEYVIADLDPVAAAEADLKEAGNGQAGEAKTDDTKNSAKGNGKKRGRHSMRSVAATGARGIAVARTAGG